MCPTLPLNTFESHCKQRENIETQNFRFADQIGLNSSGWIDSKNRNPFVAWLLLIAFLNTAGISVKYDGTGNENVPFRGIGSSKC